MAWPHESVTLPALDLTVSGKRFLSSQSGGGDLLRDLPTYAKMMQDSSLDAAAIMTRTFALDELNEAFEAARQREVLTGVVLL
jgi:S-(hydroxymethyl)glutathione dehydrogenase/alcohol dehydrogenase